MYQISDVMANLKKALKGLFPFGSPQRYKEKEASKQKQKMDNDLKEY